MLKYYIAQKKGLRNVVNKKTSILYVGASHGRTVAKLSKECKIIYALDVSVVTTKKLLEIAEKQTNIAPILADANKINEYKNRVGKIDFIFQDIAQKDQVRIFKKLISHFKPKHAMLALKTKNIDSIKSKELVLKDALEELSDFDIEYVDLSPEIKDHYAIFI